MDKVRMLQVALFGAVLLAVIVTLTSVVQALDPTIAQAPTPTEVTTIPREFGLAIGAGIAMGIAGFGVGIGMGNASASAMAAIAEKPEVFGRTIVYVVLIEAVAIYALVVSIIMIGLI
ncbi:MAG: ATP synthase subunit C [Promethearchaeota archaeon]